MRKAELVAEMAQRSGLNRSQTKDALEAFIGCISASLKAGSEVRIVGFGNFVAVKRPEGPARNPRTGAKVTRPASVTVRFRPGEGLKNAVN